MAIKVWGGFLSDLEVIHKCLSESVSNIDKLEDFLCEQPQTDVPVKNSNVQGMYTREIVIPKDHFITGRVHIFDYVDIMLSGDITIATEDGFKRFTGPNVFHGKAGRKRAGYTHEETRWITVHNWDSDNGDDYTNKLTCLNMGQFNAVAESRKDYMNLISELGSTEKDVREVVDNEIDMIAMPSEFEDSVYIDHSFIDGQGLFSNKEFSIGDVICVGSIDGMRTIGGRYSNHSITQNAKMQPYENGFNLVAITPIEKGDEITTNYRDTLISRGVLCHR